MRAYKQTTSKDGSTPKESFVQRSELGPLVRNLFYFNKLFSVFDDIDTGDDRRVDFAEFKAGLSKIGQSLSDEEAKNEFAKIDKNGGGQVLFDEFCAWVAESKCPVD